jgi:hypothetical protein
MRERSASADLLALATNACFFISRVTAPRYRAAQKRRAEEPGTHRLPKKPADGWPGSQRRFELTAATVPGG